MDTRKTRPIDATEVMTVQNVAEYFHCHTSTIYRLLKNEGLPAFRLGGDWRFLRTDIDKWIADKHARPLAPAITGPGRGRRSRKTIQ